MVQTHTLELELELELSLKLSLELRYTEKKNAYTLARSAVSGRFHHPLLALPEVKCLERRGMEKKSSLETELRARLETQQSAGCIKARVQRRRTSRREPAIAKCNAAGRGAFLQSGPSGVDATQPSLLLLPAFG